MYIEFFITQPKRLAYGGKRGGIETLSLLLRVTHFVPLLRRYSAPCGWNAASYFIGSEARVPRLSERRSSFKSAWLRRFAFARSLQCKFNLNRVLAHVAPRRRSGTQRIKRDRPGMLRNCHQRQKLARKTSAMTNDGRSKSTYPTSTNIQRKIPLRMRRFVSL